MIYIILGSWYLIGVISFIYWWTTEFELTRRVFPTCLLAGMAGPFSFYYGRQIHAKDEEE